jgi:hypothetical protein
VPFAEDLQAAFGRRAFWADYYWLTEVAAAYPELRDRAIEFRVSDQHALSLRLTEDLYEHTLYLPDTATGDLIQLGWADQAHPHQNVLRWEELEAVCRCLAARDPTLGHPGIPLLLLQPFAPITAADDQGAIRALAGRAWRATSLFSEREIEALVEETCFSWDERDLRWGWDARRRRWTAEGEFPQSLRRAENEQFPFAQLEALFHRARRCAASA